MTLKIETQVIPDCRGTEAGEGGQTQETKTQLQKLRLRVYAKPRGSEPAGPFFSETPGFSSHKAGGTCCFPCSRGRDTGASSKLADWHRRFNPLCHRHKFLFLFYFLPLGPSRLCIPRTAYWALLRPLKRSLEAPGWGGWRGAG